ncbi:hypothetical protein ABI019_15640, partial [Enterococcus faecium]|uniref:hypothetical protein n=1 Tax=Enterococcus faecium TaxID=1352 RepID=UPI003F443AA2
MKLYAPGGSSEIGFTGSSANYWGGTNTLHVANFANGPLTFFTNSSERMRIDASGNVGINTT